MTPRGGIRPGAGRPATPDRGKRVGIVLRETDEARALARGEPIAVRCRRALDCLAALEDGAGITALRRIASAALTAECERREGDG